MIHDSYLLVQISKTDNISYPHHEELGNLLSMEMYTEMERIDFSCEGDHAYYGKLQHTVSYVPSIPRQQKKNFVF